jgi:hypothetical protein
MGKAMVEALYFVKFAKNCKFISEHPEFSHLKIHGVLVKAGLMTT